MTTTEFEALPLNDQRKIVANDVINQLTYDKYCATEGIYVQFKSPDNVKIGDDVQSTLDALEYCNVCAYGALLLSAIRFKNNVNWDRSLHQGFISKQDNYTKPLKELFSSDQLELIEDAYEGWESDLHGRGTVDFYWNYTNSTDRLIGIMTNIIANNGEFIL